MTAPPRRGLAIAAVVLIVDQASKAWALASVFEPPRRIAVLATLDIVAVWNRGVSFGLLASDSPWAPVLLGGFALAVCGLLTAWLWRAETWPLALGLGAVIGGALGNVIDRFRFGAVVDFIDVHYGGWHWPAFNIADSAITIGVFLLLLDAFGVGRRRHGKGHGGDDGGDD